MALGRVLGLGLVAMALVSMLWMGASAQTGCMSAIISLSPCLSYVTGSSRSPSSSCCTQLAGVVKTNVQCLCTVLNGGGSSLGISINRTQALALPSACNVKTPPPSQCNATGGPSANSPAEAPASSTPPVTPSPQGDGSKTETTNVRGQSSDASSMELALLMVFLTFIASVSSALTIY